MFCWTTWARAAGTAPTPIRRAHTTGTVSVRCMGTILDEVGPDRVAWAQFFTFLTTARCQQPVSLFPAGYSLLATGYRQRALPLVARPYIRNGIRERVDETRVRVDRFRTLHQHARRPARLGRLDVEVIQHFHVIAEKADGAEDDGVASVRAFAAQ